MYISVCLCILYTFKCIRSIIYPRKLFRKLLIIPATVWYDDFNKSKRSESNFHGDGFVSIIQLRVNYSALVFLFYPGQKICLPPFCASNTYTAIGSDQYSTKVKSQHIFFPTKKHVTTTTGRPAQPRNYRRQRWRQRGRRRRHGRRPVRVLRRSHLRCSRHRRHLPRPRQRRMGSDRFPDGGQMGQGLVLFSIS